MANTHQEDEVDFIGTNIKSFKTSNNDANKDEWRWPPPKEVMTFFDQYLMSNASNEIKTCFEFDEIPSPVPDASGSSVYSLAAHCLIYAPTNDLWKGCAMVSKRDCFCTFLNTLF